MAKAFRVIALSMHLASTQKIYRTGDIIPADLFAESESDKLVANGHIEPYSGKKTEHSANENPGAPHIVTEADVERNPDAGLTVGETVYLPQDGLVLDDAENQARNEEGAASGDGKVLVTQDQQKAPITDGPVTTVQQAVEDVQKAQTENGGAQVVTASGGAVQAKNVKDAVAAAAGKKK